MAISVDTVYQKVLALANKEQRGYITPQEFNLLADKAQLDIFESYFHDLKTAYHKPKTNLPSTDESDNIKTKLHPFLTNDIIILNSLVNSFSLPDDLYKIDTMTYKYPISIYPAEYSTVPVEEISQQKSMYTETHPLLKASKTRPVFTRISNLPTQTTTTKKIAIYPDPTLIPAAELTLTVFTLFYWRKPISPNWGYVLVENQQGYKKALYNSNLGVSKNFELHDSEEEALVTRILQLSGIIIESPGLVEIAMTDNANTKAEQNN